MSAINQSINEKFGRLKSYCGYSVLMEYSQLAQDYKPINLALGFPDYSPPNYVTETLATVAKSDNCLLHQYTRAYGHPRLVTVLAKLYSQLLGRNINAETEVLTTIGAYGALYTAIVGHVGVGDEVIIIEPFFLCYESMVRTAGGIPKFVLLRQNKKTAEAGNTSGNSLSTSADWTFDADELSAQFGPKTKAIILNTPNNPLGKVYTQNELQIIADLCQKWNVLCISDEVYEWMVYKPQKHIRIATLNGMWERTLTIGSAGKSFNVTGWRVGWVYGPANLMVNLQMVYLNCIDMGNTIIQEALAICFEKELTRLNQKDCCFNSNTEELKLKRDFMAKLLMDTGMQPILPEAGYFMIADWSPLEHNIDLSKECDKYKDFRFTKWMTKNVGLQGLPTTAFYSESSKCLADNFVRYCFCKKDDTLQRTATILVEWKRQ